jgi:hypothetical protein
MIQACAIGNCSGFVRSSCQAPKTPPATRQGSDDATERSPTHRGLPFLLPLSHQQQSLLAPMGLAPDDNGTTISASS